MANGSDPLGSAGSDPSKSAGSTSDSGVLGQDDIEKLLAAASAGKGVPATPAQPAPPAAPAQTASAPPKPRPQAIESGLAQGDVEYLLSQAEQALASIDSPVDPPGAPPVQPFKLQDFTGAPPNAEAATLDLIRDVELDLKIELGRTEMYLEDVLKLRKGSVVPLDKLAGDPVDIYVNGRLIARGEVLVLNDNFCVRVAELIASENVA